MSKVETTGPNTTEPGKIWIGLFRGINIGGNRMPMKDLVKRLEAEGLSDVKTYIASGNVLFRSDRSEADLQGMIEDLVEKNFGFRSKLFLIDLKHLEKLMAANPFKDHEHRGKAQHIFFLKAPATGVKNDLMQELKAYNEAYHLSDEAFYFYAPDGIGRSKLMEKLDRCLKADMTARNLNTVETLRDMAEALEK
ncbi:DUF1697 domain-containing protein [Asticcacaulis sp. AC402]|uniref:DUF1697 domain-containing protein n=1 Tax=Asticcacaulis sp. AC402 TaxID=1282361 RepID=UPI0003C3C794|nr:DUF1697 domain-containing protein [Asticcacaulis sp. AC402]ESQ75355.1 hypothetical protein ABAC402_09630 [Asticcacaulis sp. AC402]